MNLIFLLGDCTAKGGIEKVTISLAEALSTYFNSSITSLYQSNPKVSFKLNSIPVDYLNNRHEKSMYNRKYKSLVAGILFDFCYIFFKLPALRRSLKNRSADFLVSCDIKMTVLAIFATMFTRCKVIVIEHFEYDVPNTILKKIRKLIYRYVSSVVILTDEDKPKYDWLEKSKIHIIPNIVSINFDGYQVKKKIIIAVGRMCYQKGFDLLIEAWSHIATEQHDWTLQIYGEGEDKVMLENLIDAYQLNNVELHPFTSNIDEVYQKASAFVLSSRFEGLGMVLIEALAHQLPCVSFDCPAGPKTIIKHGVNGSLVTTGNVVELSEAISVLLNNKELRNRYSSNSVASISNFSQDVVVGKWINLVRGIANEKC